MRFISAVSASLAFLACAFSVQAETYFWHRDPALTGAGGIAKSYNWTSRQNGTGNPPASVTDETFDAAVLDTSTAWKFIDADDGAATGSYELKDGKLLLTAQGPDFSKSWRYFAGIYRSDIKGTFDVTVRVDSQVAVSDWSKAGIILANDIRNLDAGGVTLLSLTPRKGVIFEWSTSVRGQVTDIAYSNPAGALAWPVWLRLVRNPTQVTAYFRRDTTAAWSQIGSAVSPLGIASATDMQVGLFTVSVDSVGKAPKVTTAAFDDFRGGGDIASPDLDLRFGGTGTNANVAVTLASDFSAGSIDFTGFTSSLTFNSRTLSVARNLRFHSGMSIVADAGNLVLTGSAGPDTLWARPNDTLPAIRKTGAGKLVLMGGTLAAGALRLDAGSFDLNDNGAQFPGLSGSGGSLEGLGADDSLTVAGDADFSGLTAVTLPLGNVVIKSIGNGLATAFNPGWKIFPKLTLSTWATGTSGTVLMIGPGSLTAAGGLVFRNRGSASGVDATLDFHTHSPSITVGGDLLQVQDGAGAGKHILRLGDGTWSVGGNVTLSLAGGGSGDSAIFRFTKASGIQALAVANGPLFSVEHTGAGTLRLGSALSATHLLQSAGALDFNGFDVALKGDLKVEKGVPATLLNLAGRTVTVEGNASFAGKSRSELLGLNPAAAWRLKVSGTLAADSAAIANSDASGFTKGIAGESCVDGKGNANWQFWMPPQPPSIARQPVDVIAKPGWTASFSLLAQGSGTLSYEWKKEGDSAVLSRDTLLLLDSVQESQNDNLYYCVVANALGQDTSVRAKLTVRSCDSAYFPPADFSIAEGGQAVLAGKTGCASEVLWVPVSGPIPKLLDPQVDTLRFTAPRVKGDSLLVLQYNARFGANWESKNVTVKVKDTIPDPQASLDTLPPWDGRGSKVVKPKIANAAALAKFPGYPLRYLWSVSPLIADSTVNGDSLALKNAFEDGDMEITLCADNGGSPSCAKTVLEIRRIATSLLFGRGHAGPVRFSDGRLTWNESGLARIVDWRGRVLWQSWGSAGYSAALPVSAGRSLKARAARMEFLGAKKAR